MLSLAGETYQSSEELGRWKGSPFFGVEKKVLPYVMCTVKLRWEFLSMFCRLLQQCSITMCFPSESVFLLLMKKCCLSETMNRCFLSVETTAVGLRLAC